MAYYTALIAAWNGATQPPTGVTGTALAAQMTTQQKCDAVNGWTVVGAAIPMIVPSYLIYNAIVPSEFQALPATNQQLIRDIFSQGTVDGSSGKNARTVILQVFGAATATRTALTAIAKPYDAPALSWATTPVAQSGAGLNGPVNLNDAKAAGLT